MARPPALAAAAAAAESKQQQQPEPRAWLFIQADDATVVVPLSQATEAVPAATWAYLASTPAPGATARDRTVRLDTVPRALRLLATCIRGVGLPSELFPPAGGPAIDPAAAQASEYVVDPVYLHMARQLGYHALVSAIWTWTPAGQAEAAEARRAEAERANDAARAAAETAAASLHAAKVAAQNAEEARARAIAAASAAGGVPLGVPPPVRTPYQLQLAANGRGGPRAVRIEELTDSQQPPPGQEWFSSGGGP